MESVQEVNQSIVKLCMIIQQHYPELEKYLDEMLGKIQIKVGKTKEELHKIIASI